VALDPFLGQEPDRRLARKLLAARLLFVLLAMAWVGLLLADASNGEMSVHASSPGRSKSLAYMRVLTWQESPGLFLLSLLFYAGIGLVMVGASGHVASTFIRRWHGRPLFKRKYPY
jgi:hypothetical protein